MSVEYSVDAISILLARPFYFNFPLLWTVAGAKGLSLLQSVAVAG
jgi:hypothetical protein